MGYTSFVARTRGFRLLERPSPGMETAMRIPIDDTESNSEWVLTDQIKSCGDQTGHLFDLIERNLQTFKEIVEALSKSMSTVRNHVQNIFDKLGVHSRPEAIAW